MSGIVESAAGGLWRDPVKVVVNPGRGGKAYAGAEKRRKRLTFGDSLETSALLSPVALLHWRDWTQTFKTMRGQRACSVHRKPGLTDFLKYNNKKQLSQENLFLVRNSRPELILAKSSSFGLFVLKDQS